ncbi:MAG: double-strand break repair helicase HerA and related ATPase [Thermoanaerobaculia bacterium]|jgi:DNA helicase HerA-like ATPase|nr:double-strand break repair helicase HerA and related ATPase [Thermoanaerobaculia bacterium]
MTSFDDTFKTAFGFANPSIDIGHVLQEGVPQGELPVRIPLAMMNRHGLIAGSTGTGKTRTLQLLAEGLSRNGVPVFLSDVKGDLAGMSRPGEANERVVARMKSVGRRFVPESFPVEFFSLTGANGVQLRATVSSFGPILLGKVLDLTDTQQSVLAMVFKYCDDRQMPLLDFPDLRDVLNYLSGPGKADLKEYGGMATATVGVLVRKMVELEQQGAGRFFGEPELDIHDLMRSDGSRGVVNILSLADVQDKPRLYSTFLMWLLGQFYYKLPEVGDPEKPKLVFFFDEAHLLFEDASSTLVEHIEQVARLIRSKGVGVFFITQTPGDVADNVLAQLGNRVQHAVRAFTPKDAKNLKATASTFPPNPYVDVQKTLTALGTGEALVSILNPKGVPTPVAPTQILAPSSAMGSIDDAGYREVISRSYIGPKYANAIDRESAHEILQRKLAASAGDEAAATPAREGRASTKTASSKGTFDDMMNSPLAKTVIRTATSQAARTVTQQVIRGIFGMLKGR